MSQKRPRRSCGSHLAALTVGFIALIYLANPTLGFIEFIPDNLPLVGNLDEAGATLLLLNSLRFYGIDMLALFGNGGKAGRQGNVIDGEYREKPPRRR